MHYFADFRMVFTTASSVSELWSSHVCAAVESRGVGVVDSDASGDQDGLAKAPLRFILETTRDAAAGKHTFLDKPIANTIADELAEFAACIRGEAEPEVGGERATASLAVIRAGVKSAAEGRRVEVAEALAE